MIEQRGNWLITQIGQAQKHGIVTQTSSQLRLHSRLGLLSTDTCYFHNFPAPHLFHGELQHSTQQRKLRIADGELSGVNSDCNSSRSRCKVISRERTLPSFIKLALRR